MLRRKIEHTGVQRRSEWGEEEGQTKAVPFGMIKSSLAGNRNIQEIPEVGKGISQVERVIQAKGPGGTKAMEVRRVHGCHV